MKYKLTHDEKRFIRRDLINDYLHKGMRLSEIISAVIDAEFHRFGMTLRAYR